MVIRADLDACGRERGAVRRDTGERVHLGRDRKAISRSQTAVNHDVCHYCDVLGRSEAPSAVVAGGVETAERLENERAVRPCAD